MPDGGLDDVRLVLAFQHVVLIDPELGNPGWHAGWSEARPPKAELQEILLLHERMRGIAVRAAWQR